LDRRYVGVFYLGSLVESPIFLSKYILVFKGIFMCLESRAGRKAVSSRHALLSELDQSRVGWKDGNRLLGPARMRREESLACLLNLKGESDSSR
jgi:hypothetical protein